MKRGHRGTGYTVLLVFLSAFLLFQIQPLISKTILPWFGGAPSLWSTAMLFFQVLLMGGYAYAGCLVSRLSPRRQGIVHLALLGFSLILLLALGLAWDSPITPDGRWRPQGTEVPQWQILKILAVAVGVPYFILSTTSPLLQTWLHYREPGRSPYYLYALSNAGSLLGLLTYPFLVEPVLALRTQANLWAWGYVAFALCAGYSAFNTLRLSAGPPGRRVRPRIPAAGPQAEGEARPGVGVRFLWVALAAAASVMLLATTNQISQEVSVTPFLWVLPLALYLLSFILCFAGPRWYSRTGYTVALFAGTLVFCWIFYYGRGTLLAEIAVYSLVLFICCMVCHGELVCLKPHPHYLASFYLLVSAGGVLGGVAVNLVAPQVFKGFWELPLGLLACWVLLLLAFARDWQADQGRRTRWLTDTLLMGGIAVLCVVLFLYVGKSHANVLHSSRNFYGVLWVREMNAGEPERQAYKLVHGMTLHGFQYVQEEQRRLPTAYYTEESGVGLALRHLPRRGAGLRVGIIGLGVGTLAAYGRPGDTMRFYEINPEVIRLAEGEGGYFSYLENCPARVQVMPGDARVSLERELATAGSQQFDLLVVDAFSSDSIPVHLLTREAFDVYLRHLQPDGILALHISNRHVNLRPVVQQLADHFQLGTALINDEGAGERRFWSTWMLATRNEEFLKQPQVAERASPPHSYTGFRLWTDDYSSLFQIVNWGQLPTGLLEGLDASS